ncbi:MAG: 4-hydroxy-tetrahydrodipicolinate reductase [Cyclobacteriaceae bacterium]
MKVAVSGATGRLGGAIAEGVSASTSMQLRGIYSPRHAGKSIAGIEVADSFDAIDADVIVECAPPDVVMENLRRWHAKGMSAVVGTSGFTEERIAELKSFWKGSDKGCLVVPNFSIGAVLMMRFAELAAPHFDSAEIIERHGDKKPDAPSGTALATAMRMGKHRDQSLKQNESEMVKGVRGGTVSGVRVHSLRMKGVLSDQEVAFSNQGEIFSITHSSTSYQSFVNGALIAIRYASTIKGVEIGLDKALR